MKPQVLYAKTSVRISPAGIVHKGTQESIAVEDGRFIYRNFYSDPAVIREEDLENFVVSFQQPDF